MQKYVLSILLILIIASGCSVNNEVQIVLLAGQSNMAGAGNYDDLSITDKLRLEAVANRVKLSTNEKQAIPLTYYLSPSKSKKYKFEKFFGPELFIGIIVAEKNPEREFLLIKTALGGTSLHGVWSPDWTKEKAQIVEMDKERQSVSLYADHIQLINQNLQGLKQEGKRYNIVGIAWMQGERDAGHAICAPVYGENLERLIQAYRDDLKNPELPFVFGQINSTRGKFKAGPSMVRKAMTEVAQSTNACIMIPTSTDSKWSDYPKYVDNTHYNTEGQKRLGTNMAKALQSLTNSE